MFFIVFGPERKKKMSEAVSQATCAPFMLLSKRGEIEG
jgi:hypothetical protein